MKLFQAATSGRGRDVEMMVSSMSEMMPKSWSSPMTCTGAPTCSAPGLSRRTWCQPAASPGVSMVVSRWPRRSVVKRWALPEMVTLMTPFGTGTVKKLRQPRRFSHSGEPMGHARWRRAGPRTSWPRTRTRDGVPRPVNGTIRGRQPARLNAEPR
ncbi:hypothetical protein [Propionibacterium freudenreichii]|uniref:hypothetical protein n=1 Tax=Propionibacterium freudenreichii TaxID=1744 RepID=UPI0025502AC4|nr:hypothetical protein [Propionibacterium freudenreichii]